MVEPRGVKVVVIGGGTGSFALLSGLKQYTQDITALVSMADDGSSTGILRDELGALPPGDVRQCLVALSRSSLTMRNLFNYRFPKDSFAAGHSFGNLFITALEKITNNFAEGVKVASEVLNIVGQVLPITLDNIRLVMQNERGQVITGEGKICDESFDGRRSQFWLEPAATINPEAEQAILAADIVVLAPGDIYTSLAPALLVGNVGSALQKTKAKVVYVCNLVTSHGQTDNFKVHDFATQIERFIGAPRLDFVLYNSKQPSASLLKRYAKDQEFGVEVDKVVLKKAHYKAIGTELISSMVQEANPNDSLFKRTYIRHDGEKVAKQLLKLYFN